MCYISLTILWYVTDICSHSVFSAKAIHVDTLVKNNCYCYCWCITSISKLGLSSLYPEYLVITYLLALWKGYKFFIIFNKTNVPWRFILGNLDSGLRMAHIKMENWKSRVQDSLSENPFCPTVITLILWPSWPALFQILNMQTSSHPYRFYTPKTWFLGRRTKYWPTKTILEICQIFLLLVLSVHYNTEQFIILYYSVLYCIVLYFIILYCTVVYCTVLYYSVL